MYKHALVRLPSENLVNGITSANIGIPNFELALTQHQNYIEALKKSGLAVIVLPSNDSYPDACFIEDTAIVNDKVAIISRPGAPSRLGEEKNLHRFLHPYYHQIEHIKPPGTVEGGDVLQIEDHYYIGISNRTNKEGAFQLKNILEKYGFSCTLIPLTNYLHLKTGVNYLGDNTVLVAGEFINHKAFSRYEQILVNPEDEYSASSLRINDYILTPSGFPDVSHKLTKLNKKIIEIPLSEYQKLDGGLSCLSLRF